MKQNKIGVFDSGVGGLNVLHELIKNKPNNYYIYYGDSVHLPYGNKSKDELFSYATKIIDFFISLNILTIIIACGTISSTIYPRLCTCYPQIKLISVIKPTIDYINNSHYKKVALIATETTINNGYFKDNINKELINIKTPMFVPIIEQRKKDEYDYYIDYYLKELKKANIDAIILGCTHYPSLKENIENYLNIPCIDMGVLVSSTINESNNKGLELYFSLVNNDIIENVKELIGDYQVVERRL